MANENKSDWMHYFRNPHSFVLKKYMFDLLKDKYGDHEPIINRLSSYLIVKDDIEAFGRLMATLYEAGFLRAVEQYQSGLEKSGYRVSITATTNEAAPKIFNQKNQAGPETE